MHRKAKGRAFALGISFAEHVRRLIARDLEARGPGADPSAVFALGDSGGSDIARAKDGLVGRSVEAGREGSRG